MKDKERIKTLRSILNYIKPHWLRLMVSVTMALFTVVLGLYLPILIGRAVDLIGIIHQEGSKKEFLTLLSVMAGVAGAGALTQWILNLTNNRIVFHVVRDIRKQAFDKVAELPFSYLDGHSHGDVLSRIITDVDQFADGLLIGFTQAFTGIITIAGTVLFMLRVNVAVTAVVVFLTPLSLFTANFIAKRTFGMFQLQSEARGEQTALVNEMIGNQKVVQAFGQEEEVEKQFDEINERLGKHSLRAIFYSSLTNPVTRFVNNLVYAGVGLAGALYTLSGGLTVGQLTIFLSYANQYTKPFNEISEVIAELQNALACASRVLELIEAEPEAADGMETVQEEAADGVKTAQGEAADRTETVQGEAANGTEIVQAKAAVGNVELERVYFAYRHGQKLIEDLSLCVRVGQRVAIVGPTGCGKTTVINLLMRFYDVNSGRIMLEGRDIRMLTRHSLRSAYGMVLQETWLRNGTIWDNITLGKKDATKEEVIAAAKSSRAHGFIKRLPEGYETVIGEDGGSLSQGEKQLLCIARVMINLPPMLILDEATSSIDTRTEMRIQEAFNLMMEGRTSFIVAHRLSTVRHADVILVMKNGAIIEQGEHEELMAMKGFYWEMYRSQLPVSNRLS